MTLQQHPKGRHFLFPVPPRHQPDCPAVLICRTLELHVLTPDAWFSDGVACPKLPWLSSDLLPRLVRWASECKSSEFRSTLSLLPVEKYSLVYQQLKDKYKAMVKVKDAETLRRSGYSFAERSHVFLLL